MDIFRGQDARSLFHALRRRRHSVGQPGGEARRRNSSSGYFTRRNLWLCALGLLHGTFLWHGDILFGYGLCGLLFLFPLRNLKTKTLLIAGILIGIVLATYNAIQYADGYRDIRLSKQAAAIAADQHAGKQITAEQKQLLQQWQAIVEKKSVTQKRIDEGMAEAHEGYLAHLIKEGLGYGSHGFAEFYGFELSDALGAMLIGMALFKCGFLT